MNKKRLFVKVTRESLPQIKDRYPFIYLERGRLEVDDSSVKWIDSECNIVFIPSATIGTILLGPGTSVTHEAIKALSAANCNVCWVGEDSLLFYAVSNSPTHNTKNLKKQIRLVADKKKSLETARKLFGKRITDIDLTGKTLKEMMGIEGNRVKKIYSEKSDKYNVPWIGRSFIPNNFNFSDVTNKILTSLNSALYALISSSIYSLGYSPHIGFIHSGCPLPFVYDISDLYKDDLCIDLAFYLTKINPNYYDRDLVSTHFREKVIEMDLINLIVKDISEVIW